MEIPAKVLADRIKILAQFYEARSIRSNSLEQYFHSLRDFKTKKIHRHESIFYQDLADKIMSILRVDFEEPNPEPSLAAAEDKSP